MSESINWDLRGHERRNQDSLACYTPEDQGQHKQPSSAGSVALSSISADVKREEWAAFREVALQALGDRRSFRLSS